MMRELVFFFLCFSFYCIFLLGVTRISFSFSYFLFFYVDAHAHGTEHEIIVMEYVGEKGGGGGCLGERASGAIYGS